MPRVPSEGLRADAKLQAPAAFCNRYLRQADLRCGLAADFFAGDFFLPSIGISISFCPLAAFRVFLVRLSGTGSWPTLRRRASIRSTTLLPRGRSFGVTGLPARFWLIKSISACS